MSINTAHTDGGVLIYQGEAILLHAPQAVLSFSGNDDLKKQVEKMGNAYLTSHRLIFLAKKGSADMKSFSFPFVVLSEVDVEQPVFGANYLRGKVRAQPDGGWKGEAKFKMLFKAGGAIEFATGMMRAIQIAKQMNATHAAWNQPPPAYFDVMNGGMSGANPAPPSYYNQPGNYYGWAPPSYNFPPPEAGTVYMADAPPPYPGIGSVNGYPPQSGAAAPPAYAPPQYPNAGYPSQPASNPGYAPPQDYPTNPSYSNQNIGFGNANSVYPPADPSQYAGGVAYANANGGGQAFVPAAAPPPYAPPPMMNKKND